MPSIKQPIRVAIIMAGGSSERLWPLSNTATPKQFLRITDNNKNIFEQVVSHVKPLFDAEHTFVATGNQFLQACRECDTGIQEQNIISKPFKRNTSGCIAMASAELCVKYGEAENVVMAVFQADPNITRPKVFQATVEAAMTVAEHEALVTLGITPTRLETGYGYIHVNREDSYSEKGISVYPVIEFCQNPEADTSEQYVTSGSFFWNSDMFFWKLSVFMDKRHQVSQNIKSAIKSMQKAIESSDHDKFTAISKNIDNISIGYSLLEKAKRVLALESRVGWDDIGAWDLLARQRKPEGVGNVTAGNPVLNDTRNSLIYNNTNTIDPGVVGLENIAVITSGHGVLVVAKDRVQYVKLQVEQLKSRGN